MSEKSDPNDKPWAVVVLHSSGKFLESIEMGKSMQTMYKLIPTQNLNAATRAGLIDMTLGRIRNGQPVGAPIIRFDNPHRGSGVSQFPHINIDPLGRPNASNPHIRVPASLISCADKIDKCLKGVSKALVIVAIVTDGLRICAAIYEDIDDKDHVIPQQTIKTIASIAGGWSGAAAGASGGALLGAKIGTCVGSLFGGVGAVIGAPIGAIVGGLAGGLAGGLLGSYLAGKGAEAGLDYFNSQESGPIEDWNKLFMLSHPIVLINEINNLEGRDKELAKTAAFGGAVYGGLIGSALGPPGALVGGAVGAACGFISSRIWRKNN